MRNLVGVECIDVLDCVREHVRIAGGVSSGKSCCKAEEEEEVEEF